MLRTGEDEEHHVHRHKPATGSTGVEGAVTDAARLVGIPIQESLPEDLKDGDKHDVGQLRQQRDQQFNTRPGRDGVRQKLLQCEDVARL